MHLGIIEIYEKNHHSMIFNWIKIANINSWNVTLFTTMDIYSNVKEYLNGLCHDVVIQKTIDIIFLDRVVFRKKNKIDSYLFLSLSKRPIPLLFFRIKGLFLGITVHNANAWFVKNTIRTPAHIIKRMVRERLFRKAGFIIVNNRSMMEYYFKKTSGEKPICVVPFSLRRCSQKRIVSDRFTVVYPGTINTTRKRYDNFINLALHNPEDRFILLGEISVRAEDRVVYEKMMNVENIVLFGEYVPNREFESRMLSADVLFSEIVVDFKLSDFTETYGITKDTGISYLIAEYSIPCLLNSDFKNDSIVKSGNIYFNTFIDLQEKYLMIKNSDLSHYKDNIKKEAEKITVETIAKELKETFFAEIIK